MAKSAETIKIRFGQENRGICVFVELQSGIHEEALDTYRLPCYEEMGELEKLRSGSFGEFQGMNPIWRSSTLSSIASLSFSQKQALTSSWRLLRPQAPALFRKIYLELEIVSNKVKQIFYKALYVDAFNKDEENIATMDVHIKLTVKFFDDLLAALDDEAECIDRMKRIGMSHAILSRSCGFTSDIWERLGEISMERICSHEIVQKTREAARAWRILLACVIDELRSGFDGEARYHRKSLSSDQLDDVDGVEDEPDSNIQEKMRQLRMEYDSTVPYE